MMSLDIYYGGWHERREVENVERKFEARFGPDVKLHKVVLEVCYYVECTTKLTAKHREVLEWLLSDRLSDVPLSKESILEQQLREFSKNLELVEIGPRLNFETAFSSNATNICRSCGLDGITRMERSRRIFLATDGPVCRLEGFADFLEDLHDPMTEIVYDAPLQCFPSPPPPAHWDTVPVMKDGAAALRVVNQSMGLGFDDWDIDYYTEIFGKTMGRDPTTVECFDISQSNSEHSRHWFFKGQLVIDGESVPDSLLDLVIATLKKNPSNSVLAFCDNSSTMRGRVVSHIVPESPAEPSAMICKEMDTDLLFTAETHNFPTGIAPFPGAETGVGGRIRDTHATGRGSLVIAGTAGYSVGNLRIPGISLPWEENCPPSIVEGSRFAKPLDVLVEASNGASDYGNKFGEPLINGFCRSYGQYTTYIDDLGNTTTEHREYLKPIMFSGGFGQMDHAHATKGKPVPEMKVVKVGGPAFRIGVGGGAASSMVQGSNKKSLDFQAVQRGDAEMEQKLNRVIRACVELGENNPIVSIHDQGAGGNGNVLKEIVEPSGGRFQVRDVLLGDQSLSVLEIWGAEYQENDALLLPNDEAALVLFDSICKREACPYSIVGIVTDSGRVVLEDARDDSTPLDLDLDQVLGKMPRKTFKSDRHKRTPKPFALSADLTGIPIAECVETLLEKIFHLVSVGSKRFLTVKVDRSVTGLVAQQQCVGPLHTPLANLGAVAHSYTSYAGGATAVGEQPVKGLLNPAAMGRLCVGEMLTNLVWMKTDGLDYVKCSGNWMWPAKVPHEDAALYDTCVAMCDVMKELGVAIDGGKDSLSMAAKGADAHGNPVLVKSPGTLVVSGYVSCEDIRVKVTPDLKGRGGTTVVLIDLGFGKNRMGGSAVAQTLSCLGGASCPDLEHPQTFATVWNFLQSCVATGRIMAGHDRSDGGLIGAVLEMAFAGNCGLEVIVPGADKAMAHQAVVEVLFAEELGVLVEIPTDDADALVQELGALGAMACCVGRTTAEDRVTVSVQWPDGTQDTVLDREMTALRDLWERTSFALDERQANPRCVREEREGMKLRKDPPYQLTYEPVAPSAFLAAHPKRPGVAVLRQEGSNGDREMCAAFHLSGFQVFDVTMTDLLNNRFELSRVQGVALVGGFSFADVMGSGKGWAGTLRYHPEVMDKLTAFRNRSDTFSLGICNGCQLMGILGWTNRDGVPEDSQPRFVENESERFESRFTTLKIEKSPSIFFREMEGTTLGCWSSHGEGRAYFPSKNVLEDVLESGLAPVRYVDDDNNVTTKYPFCPNGSAAGIAALCSPCGRHLAMMPHPERTINTWNWAWMPREWSHRDVSPWLTMFQNAYLWTVSHTL